MDVHHLLSDLFGRVAEHVETILDGTDAELLTRRPGLETNPIGWLVWHLTRVEDAQVAPLIDGRQLWADGPWAARLGLAPDPRNSGYGHSAADVAAVRPDGPDVLLDHFRAVRARTVEFLATLGGDDLDRVVDRAWDPPVTMGVRLVSIVDDQIQHAGAAAYVKGLLLTGT